MNSLPTAVWAALKRSPHGIVYLGLGSLCAGGVLAVDPWAAVVAMLGLGGLYHLRCSVGERHEIKMAQLQNETERLKLDGVKANSKARPLPQQLPLFGTTDNGTG